MFWPGGHYGLQRYLWVSGFNICGQHDHRIKALNKGNTYIYQLSKLPLKIPTFKVYNYKSKYRYKHYAVFVNSGGVGTFFGRGATRGGYFRFWDARGMYRQEPIQIRTLCNFSKHMAPTLYTSRPQVTPQTGNPYKTRGSCRRCATPTGKALWQTRDPYMIGKGPYWQKAPHKQGDITYQLLPSQISRK